MRDIRPEYIRLANERPELRVDIVPMLRLASTCSQVTGGQRKQFIDQVWDMFVLTYQKIGLTIKSPDGLMKYSTWELCIGRDGNPMAFTTMKNTSSGLKLGLAGSDGSSEGKSTLVKSLRTIFHRSGMYGEVSHAVEGIALKAGSPVVCASYAPAVLGKKVAPLDDGVHYKRALKGVGVVTKILVGRPNGVPTTTISNPQCMLSGRQAAPVNIVADDHFDIDSHISCMTDLT